MTINHGRSEILGNIHTTVLNIEGECYGIPRGQPHQYNFEDIEDIPYFGGSLYVEIFKIG